MNKKKSQSTEPQVKRCDASDVAQQQVCSPDDLQGQDKANDVTPNTDQGIGQVAERASGQAAEQEQGQITPKKQSKEQVSGQAKAQDKSQTKAPHAVMAHEKPLPILLLDAGLTFGYRQQEILALAIYLQTRGFVVLLACPQSSILRIKAQAAGVSCFDLAHKGSKMSLGLGVFLRLLWRFKKKDPLCIHAFSPDFLPLVHRLVHWRLTGATLAFYSLFEAATLPSHADHSPDAESIPQQLSPLMAKYLTCIDKVTVPSSHVRATWAQAGIEASRLKVIRPAVPALEGSVEHTAYAEHEGQAQQAQRFVFVVATEFLENSCLDVLFGAMLELEKHDFAMPWEVRVVGEGPDFATYMQRAEDLGVAPRLALLSTIDADFPLQVTLPHGHALILPQLGPQGNMHACINAWALGLPIIATHIAEYTELMEVAARISRGSKGGIITVVPQDAKALAAAMQEIMGQRARYVELAKESHTMRNYALMSRLEDTYMDVYKGGIASFGWVLPQKKK